MLKFPSKSCESLIWTANQFAKFAHAVLLIYERITINVHCTTGCTLYPGTNNKMQIVNCINYSE